MNKLPMLPLTNLMRKLKSPTKSWMKLTKRVTNKQPTTFTMIMVTLMNLEQK
jgi:hypothetical protein